MTDLNKPFFTQAVDALNAGDRRGAAILLHRELESGKTPRQFLSNVGRFAMRIGEVEFAIHAARQGIEPDSLPSLLAFLSILAATDRGHEALAEIAALPRAVQTHPQILHFRGAVALDHGRLDEAEALFRSALDAQPRALETWGALAGLKTFAAGDPDLARMEEALDTPDAPPNARAALLYGLGKAYEDLGDYDRAFDHYEKGAALRRSQATVDIDAYRRLADRTIAEVTADNLARLTPSQWEGARSFFVTGLPRSGTTLVEQMLAGHSMVATGAELNLMGLALTPARGPFDKALAYQERFDGDDPWGAIARDYVGLVNAHFRSAALVVDKSLGETALTGLQLHSMPDARIAWLRRNPEDVALSCFTTNFTSGLNWTFSLEDIAEMMRIEDRLFDHWQALFADRILAVPYEGLVASPEEWAQRLQAHFGLPVEEGLSDTSRAKRTVRTASQAQVRGKVTDGRIGRARHFAKQLAPFRDHYFA